VEVDRRALLEYWDTFSVQRWVRQLMPGDTFETEFVPVSVEDAREFVAFQEHLLACIPAGRSCVEGALPPLDDGAHPRLAELERRVAAAMDTFRPAGCGAFVKLSDRSPKDAATEGGRIQRYLRRYCCRCSGADRGSTASGLPAVYRAFTRAMRAATAREAMYLLLESFRTLEDIQLRLEIMGQAPETWDLAIAVRKWTQHLDVSMEFRCFVHRRRLTIGVQYFYDCHFPVCVRHAAAIADRVREFWEARVRDRVTAYDSYVVDIGLVGVPLGLDKHGRTVLLSDEEAPIKPPGWKFPGDPIVIELNPFDSYTDAMLLNWSTQRHLIENGAPAGFEIRMTQHETRETKTTWWRKLLALEIPSPRSGSPTGGRPQAAPPSPKPDDAPVRPLPLGATL
jgi:hypothetical protein